MANWPCRAAARRSRPCPAMPWLRLIRWLLPVLAFAAGTALAAPLPLEVGKRWDLTSDKSRQPMSLEVVGREADAFVVRWDNPYVKSVFHFRLAGGKVLLAALDMGTGLARMPADTVYFDLDAAEGARWSNALGTVDVIARGKKVAGNADGVEFQLTDPKGARTYWTLSPTAGFLAFGRGPDAFLLTGQSRTAPVAAAPAAPRPSAGAPVQLGEAAAPQRVLVGLDANPPPNEGYDEASRRNRFGMATRAGVSYLYIHPKWTEAEPRAGRYDHAEVDFKTRLAEEHNLPVSLNLRMIDTNQRAIPDAYKGWRFSDDRMVEKLAEVLRAIAPRTKGRVRWIAIGNEANNYFDSRRGEIADYAQMLRKVMPTVRQLFPQAQFTVNFTHGAAATLGSTYAPLLELMDIVSWTYYPMNADFTFQDPGRAAGDIDALVASSAGKMVLFQEIGYASATQAGSSQERQAEFLANVFQALRKHRGRVIAANFVWMSDLPQSVVDDLGRYYGMANGERFKAFLGSLGYWNRDGTPKKAWAVFAAEAARM